MTARLDGFVSWLWQVLMQIISVAAERGELWQHALPRVEAVEQWKTVLRGQAGRRSGGWVGGARHNHTKWAFSEPGRVAPERSRWPHQRTEVMVVRHLRWRVGQINLLLDLRLGNPIVGVVLCSWRVGIADFTLIKSGVALLKEK